jgi:hypothetical protein
MPNEQSKIVNSTSQSRPPAHPSRQHRSHARLSGAKFIRRIGWSTSSRCVAFCSFSYSLRMSIEPLSVCADGKVE